MNVSIYFGGVCGIYIYSYYNSTGCIRNILNKSKLLRIGRKIGVSFVLL